METKGYLDPPHPTPIQIDLGTIKMIVWDLTAGFGRDAALMASGRADAVVMIEN